jgi:hypothetical protein
LALLVITDPIEKLRVSADGAYAQADNGPQKRNVPPFQAAREHYSMCAVMTVNLPLRLRSHSESQKKPILLLYLQKHVDAACLTLARESRHIVAFDLSGTTSRAAVGSF